MKLKKYTAAILVTSLIVTSWFPGVVRAEDSAADPAIAAEVGEEETEPAAEAQEADPQKDAAEKEPETRPESEVQKPVEEKTEKAGEDSPQGMTQEEAARQIRQGFAKLLAAGELPGLIYQCESYDIKTKAKSGSSAAVKAYVGTTVYLKDVEVSEGTLWFLVTLGVNGKEYTGYVPEKYIITASEEFDAWKQDALALLKEINGAKQGLLKAAADTFETQIAGFPESYKKLLRQVHSKYPNWSFVPHNTNLDWNTVIANEMVDARNVVPNTSIASWKSTKTGDYDPVTGKWVIKCAPSGVQASEAIIKYYMDPRNFLTATSAMFQFELLTYRSDTQSLAGVNAILNKTFMASNKAKIPNASNKNVTYSEAFMEIGKTVNTSPYLLASRVRQEQSETSPLISGTYKGYEGYYNYFNIKASGKTPTIVITNGLKYAKEQGWNTRYKSLLGGSKILSANYINKGQNTLYLQKFDVDSQDKQLYWHQYMQNLSAPTSEASSVKTAYDSAGITNSKFVFRIPVYNNMPAAACAKPTGTTVNTSPPAKPGNTSITAAAVASCTSVKITWGQAAGAVKYQLYRADSASDKYTRVATVSGTSYTNTGLTAGKTYYYKVRAYAQNDFAKSYSAYSAVKSIKVTPPKTTVTKISSPAKKKVKLTWTKVSNASGYIVYRSTSKNGSYKAVKTVTSGSTLSYTNTGLKSKKKYYYKVKAYRTVIESKVKSAYSNIKSIKVK